MSKAIPIVILLVILVVGLIVLAPQDVEEEYIRIHIRANSNEKVDQAIKYLIKDKVVEYITPIASSIESKEDMYRILGNSLISIKSVVDKELAVNMFNYISTIRLSQESFPTRTYQDLTLQGGIYDALIIELGSGNGDNWWCVAFPPLCFSQSPDTTAQAQYRSIIWKWLGK